MSYGDQLVSVSAHMRKTAATTWLRAYLDFLSLTLELLEHLQRIWRLE